MKSIPSELTAPILKRSARATQDRRGCFVRKLVALVHGASLLRLSQDCARTYLKVNGRHRNKLSFKGLNKTTYRIRQGLRDNRGIKVPAHGIRRLAYATNLTEDDQETGSEEFPTKVTTVKRSSDSFDERSDFGHPGVDRTAGIFSFITQQEDVRADHGNTQQLYTEEQMKAHWAIMSTMEEARLVVPHIPQTKIIYDLGVGEHISYLVTRSYHLGAMGRYSATALPIIGGWGQHA